MLLSVDHVTHYRYDRPVRGVVQSHRLMPSKFDGQKVLDWSVTMTGGTMGGRFAMARAIGCRAGRWQARSMRSRCG